MNKHFLLLFMLVPAVCFSQKTKHAYIAYYKDISISYAVSYNELNKPIDTVFSLIGNDFEYPQLSKQTVLYTGNLPDLYEILFNGKEMIKAKEDSTSTNINGATISIIIQYGYRFLKVKEPKENGTGYTLITPVILTKLLEASEVYARKNKIKI